MSIRLNKVTKEFNIGLQTAVEFLQKKGFTDVEANPNYKITEEQYAQLQSEFSLDKGLRNEATQLIQQHIGQNKKERKEAPKPKPVEEVQIEAPKVEGPKILGHIDLDGGKAAKAEKAAKAKPVEEKKPEPKPVEKEEKPKPAPKKKEEPVVKKEEPVAKEEVVAPKEEPAEPAPAEKQEEEIFRLNPVQSNAPSLTIKGKIDLDSLNQTTRPKKKTHEERRRERLEAQGGDKKKRVRLGKERVDVNDVANQQQGQKKNGGNAQQYRREKREAIRQGMEEELANEAAESKVLKLTEFVTANELATMMNVPVTKIIATCMSIGIMVSINQRMDAETINLVAEEFGFTTEYVSAEVSAAVSEEEDDEQDLVPRAPIVTVMGHVDHGKTSLLDYIRQTNVIAGEAGGITQHIGAYNVTLDDGRHVTFLDTPGHEAFTAMRARGAQVTDIAIIIIAADDDIMPQTKEAIAHATAAGVPIVFAINKIDKPGANPDKIKEGLANMNFLVEEWGGKYQSQDISAKKGIGVEELLEKVLLEAEMLDLKANPNRKATGSIIESSLDKGRGYVATVLVSNGTLHVGDIVLAGTNYGRVKAMLNERGQRVEAIGPSQAATVLGLNGAPQAGDAFHVMDSDQEAREIANKREQLAREQGLRTMKRRGLEELAHNIALGGVQELNLIVKGDVDGSIEALSDSLIKLSTEKIQVNVIYKAVGQISESDVNMAAAAENCFIVGFQVRPSAPARKLAEQMDVDIRLYSVIYDAIEEVKDAMEGMLSPEIKEEVTAQVEVRQVYHITKVGTVAGAYVVDGKVSRTNKARVIRDGIVVFTGAINALKRFKDDVKEVSTNFECGISLVGYNDLKEGDIIETFQEIEIKATL